MEKPLNHKSRFITQGDKRSPNRAMLRAVGFSDTDFDKPIIGVANGHSDLTPCNAGLGKLADVAAEEIRKSGGMPQTFGTITISDGISMGTEGMKCSLVSREVIADSIETVCRGASMDAVICVGGCDKNMPGAMIAMARLDIPGVFVYGGTIKPGHLHGQDLTVVSSFEAVGQFCAGSIDHQEVHRAIPGNHAQGARFAGVTSPSQSATAATAVSAQPSVPSSSAISWVVAPPPTITLKRSRRPMSLR